MEIAQDGLYSLATNSVINANLESQTAYDGMSLYRVGFFETIVKTIPSYIVKEWIEIENDVDKKIKNTLDMLDIRIKFFQGLVYQYLCGGAVGVLLVDDGQEDLESELNFDRIKAFNGINIISKQYATHDILDDNILSQNYQHPTYFTIGGKKIHHSRLIVFKDPISGNSKEYWGGYSWFDKNKESAIRVYSVFKIVASLFKDNKIDVKTMDLANIASVEDEKLLKKRLLADDIIKNNFNTIPLNKDETLQRIQTSFTNIDSVMEQCFTELSASTQIPMTILFGTQTKGLNNGGQADLENFYDRIKFKQETEITKQLEKVINIIAKVNNIQENIDWDFKTLYKTNAKEEAEVNKIEMETLIGYLSDGIMLEQEVREYIKEKYNLEGDLPTLGIQEPIDNTIPDNTNGE